MKSNRFMGNLKITTKLFLGALSFSIPIAVLVFLTVSEINYDMSFGSLEKTGNAYLQSLQNLSQDLTYHQFLLSKKNPEDETQKKIREQQQAVNQRFEELRVVDKTLKKSLKLADSDLKITGTQEISYASLKALWEEIKSSIAKEQKVNALEKIQILKKNIYDAIKHVGDKSNLILDPDLDSYYLMDLTLITLPQAQKRLADLYIFTESLSDKAALSTEDKQELAVFLKLLQEADLDRVNVDVQTAIAEDANFYGVSETLQTRMPSLIDNYTNKYETLFTKIKKLKQNSTELLSNPSDQIVTIKTQEIAELQKAILDAWKESYIFWDQSRVELDRLLDSRIDAFKFERLQALLLSAVAVALACFLMYLISRSIYRPLRTFTKLAQEITQDTDLSVSIPVTGKDQIGQLGEAFNSMITSMRKLVEQLSGTTFGLAETANSIKENAEFEVKGASDQSAAIAEISSAIEELATTADHIAKNSQTVSEVAEQTLESILQIQGQVNHTNSKILNLGEKSKSIGGIIKIIEDLSEQINLLALNAAIEAAHAGDAGKGFAVVASEVRKLSERSGESAQEVRALINEIQTETNSAVLGVEESSKQVNKGLEKVQETTQQAKEISVATKQQKIATEQVTLSMHNIDKVVRQMTAATEKTAETVSHLEQEAEKVRKVIEVFKLN